MNMPTQTLNRSHIRILVVDDHPGMAVMLARAISQIRPGIEVLPATSGKTALEQAGANSVDLVITDMMMPDMNGLELIEKLRSHPAGCPAYTILITAYDVPGLKESARRLKVNETIIKPFHTERICQVVSKALEEMEQTTPPMQTGGVQRTFKILIADDLPDNVVLLSRHLVSEGYTFISASNGTEALKKTRAEMPDLILLDVHMPKKDGFEVLQEIRADPAIEHIPVIMLTAARPDPIDMEAGLNLGADDYMTKPFDRRELLARIRTKLRSKDAEDLLRRRFKELSILPEIGKDLSARLDINDLADIVLRRTVETLGAISGHIIILGPQGGLRRDYCISTAAIPANEIALPQLDDLMDQIKETRQGLIIENTHTDEHWQPKPDDPASSAIIVPLFGRLDLIGVLVLIHEHVGYFNSEHQLLLQAIASQAAIAIENVQLYAGMAQERHQLSAVLQSVADAILTFDREGRLVLLNPAGEKLFTREQAKAGFPLSAGHDCDVLNGILEESRKSKEPKTGEIVWHDGRIFSALFTPIEDGGCVALLHDISQFKEVEKVKSDFILTASHDLKDPITVITLLSQMIAKAGPLNEKQLEHAGHIHSTAESMNDLVQSLLELAKADLGMELKQDPVNVNTLVFEVIGELGPQAETKGQALLFKKTDDRSLVKGNPLQLRQALRNLIGNAIKYTAANGSITLSVEIDAQVVIVKVRDNGYGIPAEELEYIFDRYYRVRSEYVNEVEGNGLGLAIVKSIVERHGGQISVKSTPGKGSCFTLTLPLMQTAEPVKAE
jgi:signal transduction histidine kinase/PleD family two-component response regulator